MEIDTRAAAHTGEREAIVRWPWASLIVLSAAQFMVIIDATVVNVALPSIGRALHFATATDLQWVATAYVLVTGGLTLLGGRMTDLLGRRSLFFAGLLIFTAASLTTGLATSPGFIVASRILQGLGAALLTPAALSIITTTFSGQQRTTALAVWGAIGAAGGAIGVLVGGILTSWLGWQSVFFINVPIGALVAAAGLFVLPTAPRERRGIGDLDLSGTVAMIAGLGLLVFSITSFAGHGWTSARSLVPLASGIALLTAFALIERRSKNPIVPPTIWRIRSLVVGNVVFFGASGIMGGSFFVNSLYLQRVLGATAWETGVAFLPLVLAVAVGAAIASRLVPHTGLRAAFLMGLLTEGGGALLLAQVPPDAGYFTNVLPGFLAVGIGLGFSFAAGPTVIMADVKAGDAGLASGLMQTAHEIGISVGVASLSAVMTLAAVQGSLWVGYRQSMLFAAVVAGLLAAFSVIAVPSVGPSAGTRSHFH